MTGYHQAIEELRRRAQAVTPPPGGPEILPRHRPSRHPARGLPLVVGLALTAVTVWVGFVALGSIRTTDVSGGSGWLTVTSLDELSAERAIYVAEEYIFVVEVEDGPLALFALTLPERTDLVSRVLYCGNDGWFHGSRGVFDQHGYWRFGPHAWGLERVAVRVVSDRVQIDPTQRTPGPPRGIEDSSWGPKCEAGTSESESEDRPGFVSRELWVELSVPCAPLESEFCRNFSKHWPPEVQPGSSGRR